DSSLITGGIDDGQGRRLAYPPMRSGRGNRERKKGAKSQDPPPGGSQAARQERRDSIGSLNSTRKQARSVSTPHIPPTTSDRSEMSHNPFSDPLRSISSLALPSGR